MNLIIWNKTDPVKTPNKHVYTAAEWLALGRIAAGPNDKIVFGMVGDIMQSFYSLAVLVAQYEIDPALPDAEKLAEIAEAMRREQDPEYSAIQELMDIVDGKLEVDDDA